MIQVAKDKAMRLARAIASDIAVYNESTIVEAIESDTFFESLSDDIEQGRTLYLSRVSSELGEANQYYDDALVDVILASYGHVRSSIW